MHNVHMKVRTTAPDPDHGKSGFGFETTLTFTIVITSNGLETTHPRALLAGIIAGFKALKRPSAVVINGAPQWLHGLLYKGYKVRKNADLVNTLNQIIEDNQHRLEEPHV
ncbi:MAG: hypothetical protein AAF125_02670 [Chloroflexota bacterium]